MGDRNRCLINHLKLKIVIYVEEGERNESNYGKLVRVVCRLVEKYYGIIVKVC